MHRPSQVRPRRHPALSPHALRLLEARQPRRTRPTPRRPLEGLVQRLRRALKLGVGLGLGLGAAFGFGSTSGVTAAFAKTPGAAATPKDLAPTLAGGGDTASRREDDAALTDYRRILTNHVKAGRVDYRAIMAKDRDALARVVAWIGARKLPEARDHRIGFYVDAYNALTIASVLRHGRPRSVLDVKGFFDRDKHLVAGEEVTLDELEKSRLNPFARDPRTHFVLVCAAVGCPILESEAFFGSAIDDRMEAATRRYLAGPTGARVGSSRLDVSKIFDWYGEEFGGAAGVSAFVLPRLSQSQREALGPSPELGYIDYNWTLNQQ